MPKCFDFNILKAYSCLEKAFRRKANNKHQKKATIKVLKNSCFKKFIKLRGKGQQSVALLERDPVTDTPGGRL